MMINNSLVIRVVINSTHYVKSNSCMVQNFFVTLRVEKYSALPEFGLIYESNLEEVVHG